MLNFEKLIKSVEVLNDDLKKKTDEENKRINLEELEVYKYISDKKENTYTIIESILMEKGKTLIIAPMKCGKSTFSFKELYTVLKGCSYHFIFVSPKTSLLKQVESEYKVNSCYGGTGATISELPTITTPDSLYKVISALECEGKPFVICYDEVHEAELNYPHRHKLVRPFEALENELCQGVIGLTATADNIIKSMEWKKIYRVKPTELFQQTPYTNVCTGLSNSINDIAVHILKVKKANKGVPIVARINDKKKIEAVKNILNKVGIKDINTWFRNNSNEDDNSLLTEMLNRTYCDFNILLTTSLVDVGVELFPTRKPIVIDFLDYNSTLIESIQFIGRFREGVEGYHMILPKCEKDEEEIFKSYEEIKDYFYTSMTFQAGVYNQLWNKVKMECVGLKVEYNELEQEYTYSIDKYGLNSIIFQQYIKQFLYDRDKLIEFLESHFTFNSAIIRPIHYPESYTEVEDIASLVEEVKEENKAKREEFKEQFEEFVEWVEGINELEFKVLTTKPDEIPISDKWILEDIEDMYNFYWSEDMEKHRKHYYALKDYSKQGYELKELLLKALDTKWYKNYKNQCRYIESNLFYEKKKELLKLDPQLRKIKTIVYGIRSSINKLKKNEIGVKLSNKFLNELYDFCILQEPFKDMKYKSFLKHVEQIYNISTDRYRSICSAKYIITLDF